MKDIKLKVRPYSLFYFFTGIWIWSAAIVFFKRRKNEGLEKFPYKNPVILSPNHQSAFMDALVTVLPMYKRKQLSFMVRQGVFDSTLGEFFLTRLLLFPAYRIRDGKENIHKNKGSFDHINNLLEKKRGLIIFPEANHAMPRRVRPLKKGLVRGALDALDKHGVDLGVQIVPIGINYSDPQNMGGECLLNYGEPIDVKKYYDLYKENPTEAHVKLLKEVKVEMIKLAIHIENKEFYDEIEFLRELNINNTVGRKATLKTKFKQDKNLIAKAENWIDSNPEKVVELAEKIKEYQKGISKLNLRDWLFTHKSFSNFGIALNWISLLLLLPFYIVGSISNYLPFWFPHKIAKTKIKDKGFQSSVAMGLAMATFMVWYLITLILSLIFISPWYIALCIVPGMMITGALALVWQRIFNRVRAKSRYNSYSKSNDPSFLKMKVFREGISSVVSNF